MYKLIIVDDENYEIQNIKKIIDWKSYDIEIVGEAINGLDGFKITQQLLPDIIITDILMPKMDGLLMASKIREKNKDIKIIVLSVCDEFRYAQMAVKTQISSYILKPVRASELEDAVVNILKELSMLNLKKNNIYNNIEIPSLQNVFFTELMQGNYKEGKDIIEKISAYRLQDFDEKNFMVLIVEINNSIHNIHKVIEDINSITIVHSIPMENNAFAVVCCFDNTDEIDYYQVPHDLKNELKTKYEIDSTIAASTMKIGLANIIKCYEEAKKALDSKSYFGKNRVIFSEDVPKIPSNTKELSQNEIEDRLKKILFTDKKSDIDNFCEEVIASCISKDKYYVEVLLLHVVNKCNLELLKINESLNNIFNDENILYEKMCRMETIPEIDEWLRQTLLIINGYLVLKQNRKHNIIVNRIKEKIANEYKEKLTMEDIALETNLHPVYANSIFKQVTGMTFSQYFIKVRIDKAMELLKTSQYKVTQISEMVGYWNYSYFTIAFKKHVGMTPKEYREKFSVVG